MTTMNDVFANQEQFLDEVIILPFSTSRKNTGAWQTFTLPAGYTWSDFEYVEAFAGNDSAAVDSLASDTVTREVISQYPTSFRGYASFQSSSGTQYQASYRALSSTTGEWLTAGSGIFQLLKGYTKRYSSRNVSAIINVDGVEANNMVGVGQRYEIDIRTALGADYVGRDLIVQAEIYNDSAVSGGSSGWGTLQWIRLRDAGSGTAVTAHGVTANVLGDKIIVQTASTTLATSNGANSGHPFGSLTASITSALCRVKVWKIDQFVSNTAGSGGAGITTLWEGSESNNNTAIPLSVDPLQFDEIRFTAYLSDSAFSTAERGFYTTSIDPKLVVNRNLPVNVIANQYQNTTGTTYYALVFAQIITSSSFTTGFGVASYNAQFRKVEGINYQ